MAKKFKFASIILILIAGFIAFVQFGSLKQISATAADESTLSSTQSQLHQKLLERKQLLEEAVDQSKLGMENGTSSLVKYRQAKEAALRASIDLCQTKEERISIINEILKLHIQGEKQVEVDVNAGQRSESDLLKAKVDCLNIEIELLKEQIK